MNTVYVRCPTMTTQSLHQQSLYQQTYVDHHRNVTDVFVQEQYSQREFYTQHVQPTVYVNNPCPYVPPYVPPATRPPMAYDPYASQFAYRPTTVRAPPTAVGYYCVNSATAASSNGRYIYQPEPRTCPHPTANRASSTPQESYGAYSSDSSASLSPTYYITSQTQTTPIKCADAATQSNMDLEELAGAKDPEKCVDSEAFNFLAMERWATDFLRKLAEVQGDRRNSEMKLPEQHMQDIIRLALHGSDIAERVANTHCNRPCFKKIDTLCARLKQDLCRVDGVLANINSQGIAWAVKDFIFLFTRIMSAWTILKSYLYNHTEGIKKIIDLLPAGFMQVFNNWQLATIPMIDMVIQSIVNLDAGARPQKTYAGNGGGGGGGDNSPGGNRHSHCHNSPDAGSRHSPPNGNRSPAGNHFRTMKRQEAGNNQDSPPYYGSANSTPRMDEHKPSMDQQGGAGGDYLQAEAAAAAESMCKPKSCQNLIDMYTMIENSEETQRHVDASGTYLKTGTYQPLQKEQKSEIIPTRAAFVMSVPPGFTALPNLHDKANEIVTPKHKPQAKPKPMPDAAAEYKCKAKPMPEYDPYFHGCDLTPIKRQSHATAGALRRKCDDPSKFMPDLRSYVQPENADEPAKLRPELRDNAKPPQPKLEIDPYVPCFGLNPTKTQPTPELETFAIGDAMDAYETLWKGNAMQEFYPTPSDTMTPPDIMTPPEEEATPPMTDPETIKISLEKVQAEMAEDVEPKCFEQNTKAHKQLLEDLEPFASMLGPCYACVPPIDSMQNIRQFMNPYSPINTEVARDLIELKERVLELQNVAHFFQKQFTLNYYPDFFQRCHQDFIDLRAIILKCESGMYHHVYQAVHDLRRIVFVARCYLKVYFNKKLSNYIDSYEFSLGEMLSKPPHQPHEHDHINGIPGEKVFNYDIL
ncbi:LOW QUALITY PROTEIN: protein mitoshell [Drosophila obscura]|uniref:LOW QUALITY PROTEIN: protein mitoshell n=1 Tax=Drosophila obscura TaxID=7282 RepID=UPI001BB1F33C|nr:LOW QUALITY PROTEIN: protein mitoshell [Drosophila obscura]